MAQLIQLVDVSGPSVLLNGSTGLNGGKGFLIGDNFTLTAGHIVFEYDMSLNANPHLIDLSNIISDQAVFDFRQYESIYVGAVKEFWSNPPVDVERRENVFVEARVSLRSNDTVIISGGGDVGRAAPGMVLFMNPSDMEGDE